MKAPPFLYARPVRLADACRLLADNEDAQILAGGQSLMATLNMRLARPSMLVDINRVEDFTAIEPTEDGGVCIGALVRHVDVERSPLVAERMPLITKAMAHVAHLAIRNRGTHCGSLALADPSAEMPACAMALDAEFHLVSVDGDRWVAAADYFIGTYETAREPGEILTEVRYPPPAEDQVTGFGEIAIRHGDFPLVGIVATARRETGTLYDLRLVTFGCESAPRLSEVAMAAAEGQAAGEATAEAVAGAVAADIDPMDSEEVRRFQAATLVRRVIMEMSA